MNTSKFYSIAFSHHGSSVREIHFIPSFVFTLLWRTFFSACLDSRVIRADIITVAWTTRLYSRISLFIWTSIDYRVNFVVVLRISATWITTGKVNKTIIVVVDTVNTLVVSTRIVAVGCIFVIIICNRVHATKDIYWFFTVVFGARTFWVRILTTEICVFVLVII